LGKLGKERQVKVKGREKVSKGTREEGSFSMLHGC
jgi:hypothetical protein